MDLHQRGLTGFFDDLVYYGEIFLYGSWLWVFLMIIFQEELELRENVEEVGHRVGDIE